MPSAWLGNSPVAAVYDRRAFLRHPELVEGSVQSHLKWNRKDLFLMSLEVNHANETPLPIWKQWRFIVPVAVALAIILAYVERRNDRIAILLGVIAAIGLVMMMLSGLCGMLNWMFARKWPRDCTQATLVGISMFSFFVIVQLVASIFWHIDDVTVLAYPGKAVPVLEKYRQIHGAYPETLAQVPQLPPLPPGLTYYGRKKEFTFFRSYGGFFSGYSYSNDNPTWKWTDD